MTYQYVRNSNIEKIDGDCIGHSVFGPTKANSLNSFGKALFRYGIALHLMILHSLACHCIVSYGVAWYCIVGFGARAVSRKTPTYFISCLNEFQHRRFFKDSWRFFPEYILEFSRSTI